MSFFTVTVQCKCTILVLYQCLHINTERVERESEGGGKRERGGGGERGGERREEKIVHGLVTTFTRYC